MLPSAAVELFGVDFNHGVILHVVASKFAGGIVITQTQD